MASLCVFYHRSATYSLPRTFYWPNWPIVQSSRPVTHHSSTFTISMRRFESSDCSQDRDIKHTRWLSHIGYFATQLLYCAGRQTQNTAGGCATGQENQMMLDLNLCNGEVLPWEGYYHSLLGQMDLDPTTLPSRIPEKRDFSQYEVTDKLTVSSTPGSFCESALSRRRNVLKQNYSTVEYSTVCSVSLSRCSVGDVTAVQY